MNGRMSSTASLTDNLSKKNGQVLEENLASFAHRFPVAGRIVHALAQEFGGVMGLADYIEKHGMRDEAGQWITAAKTKMLTPEDIRNIFDSEILDSVSKHLAIPRESVEIQAALGLPKFFATLGHDEKDELDFGYSPSGEKSDPEAEKSRHSWVEDLHDYWPNRPRSDA
jgi:uncharacterized protein YidB (DUF937 family)